LDTLKHAKSASPGVLPISGDEVAVAVPNVPPAWSAADDLPALLAALRRSLP
jgi:hypothetical protein